MKRGHLLLIILPMIGCAERFVPAPQPEDGGAFLVHRVRTTEESFPKVLTWYTGTTLSQQIVVRYNTYVLQRELRVGDVIRIPFEVVANDRPYGEESKSIKSPAVDLLMEGPAPKTAQPPLHETSSLETFDDESSPDPKSAPVNTVAESSPAVEVAPSVMAPSSRIEVLEREIQEREAELQALKGQAAPTAPMLIDAAPTASQEVLD